MLLTWGLQLAFWVCTSVRILPASSSSDGM